MTDADLHFYFGPVCPFAWMTSRWVRTVAAQREYTVDWRFISLRLLNAHIDYDTHFPPEYEAGHTAGLKLLRVAARTRAEHSRDAVEPLYEAVSSQVFGVPPEDGTHATGSPRAGCSRRNWTFHHRAPRGPLRHRAAAEHSQHRDCPRRAAAPCGQSAASPSTGVLAVGGRDRAPPSPRSRCAADHHPRPDDQYLGQAGRPAAQARPDPET